MLRSFWLLFLVYLLGGVFLFSSCASHSSAQRKELPHQKIHPVEETSISAEHVKRYQELLKDPHLEIRLAAAKVLLEHGDRSGEAILLEALKDEGTHPRLDSFLALSENPTQEILRALQNASEVEKDAMIRFVMKRKLKEAQKKLK